MIPKLNNFIESFREKIGGEVIFVNITPWTNENGSGTFSVNKELSSLTREVYPEDFG